MQNNYIYKDLNGELFLFSYDKGSIIRNTFKDNRWLFSEEIINNVKANFTFNIINEDIFIFCQDLDYNIILVRGNNIEFESSIILKNTNGDRQSINVNIVNIRDTLTLIYNNNGSLYRQKMKDGKLEVAEELEKFYPFRNKDYEVICNKNSNYLFYKKNENSNRLVYNKLNDCSNFIYHSTSYEITDTSNLIINNEVYSTYIVKSSFSYQLFFRKIGTNSYDPIIISEGQNIDNVLIFKSDLLYIFFVSKNTIYFVQSENEGNSFSKVKKYKEYNNRLIKAKFISNGNFKMNVNDVYITNNEAKSIKVLPEIYKEFYEDFTKPIKVTQKQVQLQPRIVEKTIQEQKNVRNEKNSGIYYENLADLNNEDFYRILFEKKKQKELEKKKEEYNSFNNSEIDELEKLKQENEKLKKALKGIIR